MAANFVTTNVGDISDKVLPLHSNELWIELDGYNPASQYKYNYVIDIEISGTQIARILKKPAADNNITLNLTQFLKDRALCSFYGDDSTQVLFSHPENDSSDHPFSLPPNDTDCQKVTIKVGESLATTATGSVTLTANQNNLTFYAFNGTKQYINTSSVADLYDTTGGTDRILSDRTKNTHIFNYRDSAFSGLTSDDVLIPTWRDSYYILSFLNDTTVSSANSVQYTIVNDSGVASSVSSPLDISATYGAAAPGAASAGGASGEKVVRIGAGPANVNQWSASIGGLVKPSADANFAYYKMRLFDSNNLIACSRWYVFINKDRATSSPAFECAGGKNRYQLIWQNSRGGWDAFDFTGQARIAFENKRKMYHQSVTTKAEPFDSYHKRPAQIDSIRTYQLQTQMIQGGEEILLKNLVSSRQVFLVQLDGGSTFAPVNVKTSKYVYSPYTTMKLRNFQIEVEAAYDELIP